MARLCLMCDTKLSFLNRDAMCKDCVPTYSEWSDLMRNSAALGSFTPEKLSELKNRLRKQSLTKLYSKFYDGLVAGKELDYAAVSKLDSIQKVFELSDADVKRDDRVLPYQYVIQVRQSGKLPIVELDKNILLGAPLILKKAEVIHCLAPSILYELRSINLGYVGSSSGVSIRIAKGVYYRTGSHKGHIVKEDRLTRTSSGIIVLTNQRLLLHPNQGAKPVVIPISKIHLYRCSENGIEIFKEGRERGYFFGTGSGHSEILGICLGELLKLVD